MYKGTYVVNVNNNGFIVSDNNGNEINPLFVWDRADRPSIVYHYKNDFVVVVDPEGITIHDTNKDTKVFFESD